MTHEASSPPGSDGTPEAAPREPPEGAAPRADSAPLEPTPLAGAPAAPLADGMTEPVEPPGTADPPKEARREEEEDDDEASPAALAPVTRPRPNYVFLAVVAVVSLAADLGSKIWAKGRLEDGPDHRIEVIPRYMAFTFAKNRGGAWGLLGDQPESVRRPFFFCVSALAIIFIVSLYRRLTPQQTALKWGLPLVLGGALGNLVNRIQYNYVVDFIDAYATWGDRTHHWPTFNVADIAISVGVGLMAVDMFTARRPA